MSSTFSRKQSQKLRWRVIGEDILWGCEREISHSRLDTCSLVSDPVWGEIGAVALLKEIHTGVKLRESPASSHFWFTVSGLCLWLRM